uniref:Tumor necrosis factor receptor superfamily member 16 n=1 Tax=Romanomermis culicivorax TaxID=13658 RepID=A0A915KG52_ROMCU
MQQIASCQMHVTNFGYIQLVMITLSTICCSWPGTASRSCISDSVYDPTVESCCQTCAVGFGVALPCTSDSNNTVCSSCVDGITYSNVVSHDQPCEHCSICPPFSIVVHKCNKTHNTKCQCKLGYFYTYDKSMLCKKCSSCPPGFTFDKPCTTSQDTTCKACKGGKCLDFGHNDRVKTLFEVRRRKLSELNYQNLHNNNSAIPKLNSSKLTLIYCTPFIVIFLSLVIYVALKRWKFCDSSPSSKKSLSSKTPASVRKATANYAEMQPTNQNKSEYVLPPNRKMVEHFSTKKLPSVAKIYSLQSPQSFKKQKDMKPMLLSFDSPVLQLPTDTLDEIERLLTNCGDEKKDWKALARILGYSDSQVLNFDLRSQDNLAENDSCLTNAMKNDEGIPTSFACRQFFHQWLCNCDVSLRILCENLHKIGRRDIVASVMMHLTANEGDSCNNNNINTKLMNASMNSSGFQLFV